MNSKYNLYNIFIILLFFLLTTSLVINSGCTSYRVLPVEPEPNLSPIKLLIAPENSTVLAGSTKKFSVNYQDWDGNYHIPSNVVWSSSDGKISSEGNFFAPEKAGPVVIEAKYMGIFANTEIIVIPNDRIKEAYIVPDSVEVLVGSRLPMKLIVKNSQGFDMNYRAAWKSELGEIEVKDGITRSPNRTSTGSLDLRTKTNNFESNIVYYAPIHPGVDVIKATLSNGFVTQTSLKIIAAPPKKIEILPRNATVVAGSTEIFIANVYDRYDNLITTNVEWFAQTGNIDQDGNYTPNNVAGGDIITARYLNVTGIASVNNAPLGIPTRIEVTPSNIDVRLNDVVQFNAVGYDENNNIITLSSPIWSTNNGVIDNFGIYNSYNAAIGIARIRVTQNGVIGESYINIVNY